jgi:hypothetical protein
MEQMNIRKVRARSFLSVMMDIIDRHLRHYTQNNDCIDKIYKDLREFLVQNGAEVVTDHLRSEIGLPARGPNGWTPDELFALEKARLEQILQPIFLTRRDEDGKVEIGEIKG